MYRPKSFIDKLSSDFGLLSKRKFDLSQYQAVYFDLMKIKQFEVIIWSFCYWKKELYLVKSWLWASMNLNRSAALQDYPYRLYWHCDTYTNRYSFCIINQNLECVLGCFSDTAIKCTTEIYYVFIWPTNVVSIKPMVFFSDKISIYSLSLVHILTVIHSLR